MHENRRAVIGWCGAVSVVAATFAGIIASRPGAALSHNLLFIACIVVALATAVILLVAGYPDLHDWLRPARAGRAVTRTADPPAAATSQGQPSATATAATKALQATPASPVPGTAPTSRADGIPAPDSAGRRVTRKMAESYKEMSADTKRSIRDRMEAAEKASLLSPKVGAEAYKAIASDTRPDEYRRLSESHRMEAAEKASLLSPRVGAEAYKAIASDTRVSSFSRSEAAERACDLSPGIGAAALRAIAKDPRQRRITVRAALAVTFLWAAMFPLAVIFLFTNVCVPAAVGWLFGGHFIHLLGDHLRNVNMISFPVSLCIAVFAGALGGAMLWKFYRRNSPYRSLAFENGYGYSLLVSLWVFVAFAVGSGVFHAAASGEANHFLGIEHYSRLVCGWLSLRF